MTKELRLEVLALMLGESEQQFVSNCSKILSRHGLPKTGAAILRMETRKASEKLQAMCQPDEVELTYA